MTLRSRQHVDAAVADADYLACADFAGFAQFDLAKYFRERIEDAIKVVVKTH